jgi:mono/diheme cytochrome c family protein
MIYLQFKSPLVSKKEIIMKTLLSVKRQFGLWSGICLLTLILLGVGCSAPKEGGRSGADPSLSSGSDPKAGDPSVSQAAVRRGQELFDSVGCMGCHMVNGKGGAVGPNLSDEAGRGRSRQWLTTQIQNPKEHDPQSIMPAFNNLSNEKINDLVDYLMTLSGKKDSRDRMQGGAGKVDVGSANISLSQAGEEWSDICGRCHNLRAPSEYSDAQWTVVLDQMRLLVPLTTQEQYEILAFLKANN